MGEPSFFKTGSLSQHRLMFGVLWPVLTFVGWAVGESGVLFIGSRIVRPSNASLNWLQTVEGAIVVVLAWTLGGVLAGLGQWLILRRLVQGAGWWIPTAILVLLIAGLAFFSLGIVLRTSVGDAPDRLSWEECERLRLLPPDIKPPEMSDVGPVWPGAILGGILGCLYSLHQWRLLRRWVPRGASLWIPVNALAWALIVVVLVRLYVYPIQSFGVDLYRDFVDSYNHVVCVSVPRVFPELENWIVFGSGPVTGGVLGLLTGGALYGLYSRSD